MSDTIPIPVELYDDLVKVVNRLQACNRSSVIIGTTETSQKQGRDRPKPASKKTILINKTKKYLDNIKI